MGSIEALAVQVEDTLDRVLTKTVRLDILDRRANLLATTEVKRDLVGHGDIIIRIAIKVGMGSIDIHRLCNLIDLVLCAEHEHIVVCLQLRRTYQCLEANTIILCLVIVVFIIIIQSTLVGQRHLYIREAWVLDDFASVRPTDDVGYAGINLSFVRITEVEGQRLVGAIPRCVLELTDVGTSQTGGSQFFGREAERQRQRVPVAILDTCHRQDRPKWYSTTVLSRWHSQSYSRYR